MLAYLSHHLDEADGDESRRGDNVYNACRWLSWLVDYSDWVVVAPWFPYVACCKYIQQERLKGDQRRVLGRCDTLVLCGGLVSDHMADEISFCRRSLIAVVDLTDLGYAPPELRDAKTLLLRRYEDALAAVATPD